MSAHLLDTVPMPTRIARLPRNNVGYPIPWFVAVQQDGTRDFRVADQHKHLHALRNRLCWVCGDKMGSNLAFVIGPMCAVNRVSAEPPVHRDCAIYSARVCPFLANPSMRRRTTGLPEGYVPAAGEPILRNPGVTLVWVTRSVKVIRPDRGNAGLLCRIGDPTETLWFAHGREATRAEVLESFESGLPALQEACEKDDRPDLARRELDVQLEQALARVPA